MLKPRRRRRSCLVWGAPAAPSLTGISPSSGSPRRSCCCSCSGLGEGQSCSPGGERRESSRQDAGPGCPVPLGLPRAGMWGASASPVPSLTWGDIPRQELSSSSATARVFWSILPPLLHELEKRDLLTTGAVLGVFLLLRSKKRGFFIIIFCDICSHELGL